MKKQILSWILYLTVTLVLFGCGENSSTEYATNVPSFDTTPSTETTPPKTSTSFNLTLDEMFPILEESSVLKDFVTYETPEFIVHRTGYGTNGALLFSSPGSDKIEVAYFLAYSRASRGSIDTKAAAYAQKLLCEYCENSGIEYYAKEFQDEPYLVFAVYAYDSMLDGLPLSIREFRSENEFFANEDRVDTFRNLMSFCKYQELRDYITEFIADEQCPDDDISYYLATKIDEIIPILTTCHVEVDTVEKNAKIFYNNVTEITSSTNVVPVIETDNEYGAFLKVTAGFKRNNWLFFDTIYFSSETTETEKYLFRNTITDVLNGGNIYEGVSLGTSAHNALMAICKSDSAVIRFENSDTEEYIDHELTASELEAIDQLQTLRIIHDEIWDSFKEWEDA